MQAPINSRLGKTRRQRAGRDLLVPRRHGRAASLIAARRARRPRRRSVRSAGRPWWALVGGLLGAVYVTVALVAVRTLGASGLTAVVIAGQLAISVVIDRFGLLGVAKQPIGVAARSSGSCCSPPASCWSCASDERPRGALSRAPLLNPSRQLASAAPAELALGARVAGALRARHRRRRRTAGERARDATPGTRRGAWRRAPRRARGATRRPAPARRRRCCRRRGEPRVERGDGRPRGVVDVDERPHAAAARRRSAGAARAMSAADRAGARDRRCPGRRSSRSAAPAPPAPSTVRSSSASAAAERLNCAGGRAISGSSSPCTVPGGPGA